MIANLQYELLKKQTKTGKESGARSQRSMSSKRAGINFIEEIENSINTLEHDTECERDLPQQINISIEYHERQYQILSKDPIEPIQEKKKPDGKRGDAFAFTSMNES